MKMYLKTLMTKNYHKASIVFKHTTVSPGYQVHVVSTKIVSIPKHWTAVIDFIAVSNL